MLSRIKQLETNAWSVLAFVRVARTNALAGIEHATLEEVRPPARAATAAAIASPAGRAVDGPSPTPLNESSVSMANING